MPSHKGASMGLTQKPEADRNLGVRVGNSEGRVAPEVGSCTIDTCPRNHDLDRVAHPMAKPWRLAAQSPRRSPARGSRPTTATQRLQKALRRVSPWPKAFHLHAVQHRQRFASGGYTWQRGLAPL